MCELATLDFAEHDNAEFIDGARHIHLDVVKAVELLTGIVTQFDALYRLAADLPEADEREAATASLDRLRQSVRGVLASASTVL